MFSEMQNPALSRTAQYKKITKPLLERKRRARINRCLDELKELMVGALEAEGENISKLEKADILELTVRHLQRIHRNGSSETDQTQEAHRFQAGFGQCAAEACQFLLLLEPRLGRSLIRHLSSVPIPPPRSLCYSPPLSPTVKLSEVTNQSVHCNSTPITVSDKVVVVNPDSNDFSNEAQQCNNVSRVIYNNGNRVTVDSGTKKALRTVILERKWKIKKSESISTQSINNKQENNNIPSVSDGEEEIDIENVEELDNMWRPW